MRKKYKITGTTESAACDTAQAAYEAYCKKTLIPNKTKVCKKIDAFFKENPKCNPKCLAGHEETWATTNKIINDSTATEAQKEKAKEDKKKLPSKPLLKELAVMERETRKLLKEAKKLADDIKNNAPCVKPNCAGISRDCDKKAHSERLKRERQRKNK